MSAGDSAVWALLKIRIEHETKTPQNFANLPRFKRPPRGDKVVLRSVPEGVFNVFATGVRWFFVGVAALAIVTVIFLVITGMLGVGDTGG